MLEMSPGEDPARLGERKAVTGRGRTLPCPSFPCFFWKKAGKTTKKTRILLSYETLKIPGKEGKNAQKNKEFPARRKNKEFQKNKERKDRVDRRNRAFQSRKRAFRNTRFQNTALRLLLFTGEKPRGPIEVIHNRKVTIAARQF